MTPAAIARKASELENLIAEHRIVRCDMQQEHVTCIARVDMPEYGIEAGETFHLYAAASFPGYAYIVKEAPEGRQCSCPAHKPCKHLKAINVLMVARYYARKAAAHTMVLEPAPERREDDVVVHVADDARTGKFPTRKDMPLNGAGMKMERSPFGALVPMR